MRGRWCLAIVVGVLIAFLIINIYGSQKLIDVYFLIYFLLVIALFLITICWTQISKAIKMQNEIFKQQYRDAPVDVSDIKMATGGKHYFWNFLTIFGLYAMIVLGYSLDNIAALKNLDNKVVWGILILVFLLFCAVFFVQRIYKYF